MRYEIKGYELWFSESSVGYKVSSCGNTEEELRQDAVVVELDPDSGGTLGSYSLNKADPKVAEAVQWLIKKKTRGRGSGGNGSPGESGWKCKVIY